MYSCLRTPVRLSQTLTKFFIDGFRVKDFFVHRRGLRPTLSFVIAIFLFLGATTPALAGKAARVQIGFMAAPITPTGQYQNVLLNVIGVRINQHIGAAPTAGGWQKIPVPPGLGGSGANAELQIDLNSLQNVPQLFNTASVRTEPYKIVQLLLDSTNPGYLIPNCPKSPPAGGNSSDGCINYPIVVNNPNGITFSNPDKSVLIPTTNGTLTSFIMQVSVTITNFPIAPGGAYTVTVAVTPVTNPVTGNVTGQINVKPGTGTGTSPGGKLRKLSVTAEAIGSNTQIAMARIKPAGGNNCPPAPGGCFTLTLPAAGGLNTSPNPGFGTLYDLAVSGGAATYAAARLPPLYPGQSLTYNFTGPNSVTGNQTLGNITGQVNDGCTAGKFIVGATLQLLMPPNGGTDNTLCMSQATADQCVTVATANTDNTGAFPLPGTPTTPPAFENIPALGKNSKGYAMEVTAPGYDPLFVQALPGTGTNKKSGGTCSTDGGTTFKACNLLMMTGFITGSIPIVPPNPGETDSVQVFAEDHGTNNVESSLPMPISVGSNPNNTSVNFTLRVPPSIPVGAFDLFASTIDFYQGVVDPYQGHSIVPISDVPAPSACATVTAPTPIDPGQVITCVGHGSITGPVAVPNLGSSVVLEKIDPDPPLMDDTDEVQLTNSIVQNQPPNTTATSNYAFCAPADTYEVQELQLPVPSQSVTPIAMASPSPVPDGFATVTIPAPPTAGGPSPTPTPGIRCPTTCSYSGGNGTCPGICNQVIEPLPPMPTATPTL